MEVDILLVEDSLNDAELAMRGLRKSGFHHPLVHLKDGASALDFLFAKNEFSGRESTMPRLILLDLKMPKVDGIDVLRQIKTDNRTKKIPVVVLTSSKENQDIQQAYSLGANSYIVKPVEFDDFMNTVSSVGHYWLAMNEDPS